MCCSNYELQSHKSKLSVLFLQEWAEQELSNMSPAGDCCQWIVGNVWFPHRWRRSRLYSKLGWWGGPPTQALNHNTVRQLGEKGNSPSSTKSTLHFTLTQNIVTWICMRQSWNQGSKLRVVVRYKWIILQFGKHVYLHSGKTTSHSAAVGYLSTKTGNKWTSVNLSKVSRVNLRASLNLLGLLVEALSLHRYCLRELHGTCKILAINLRLFQANHAFNLTQ